MKRWLIYLLLFAWTGSTAIKAFPFFHWKSKEAQTSAEARKKKQKAKKKLRKKGEQKKQAVSNHYRQIFPAPANPGTP